MYYLENLRFVRLGRYQKTVGYCWPTSFKVLGVLFLGAVYSPLLPSKKAWWAHQLRYLGVGQQYPVVFRDATSCLHHGVWGVDCVLRQGYKVCVVMCA
jgi:hypothetical protein